MDTPVPQMPAQPMPEMPKAGHGKLMAWVIVGVVVLGLAYAAWAMFGSKPETSNQPQASGPSGAVKTQITYAVHWSDYQVNGVLNPDGSVKFKGLQQYLDEYNKTNPTVEVKSTFIDFGKYPDTLKLLHDSDAAPDIYQIYSTWGVTFAREGVFATPPDSVVQDVKANYVSTGGVTIDGKIWGIPSEVDDYILTYNKQLFKAAGIVDQNGNALPPKTWADFVADAVKLTKRDAKGHITQYGVSFTPRDYVADAFLSLLMTNNGQYLSTDLKTCKASSPAGVATLDALTSVFKKGATDLNASVADFGKGTVAMVVMAPWQKNGLVKAFGDQFDATVGTTALPYLKKPGSLQYNWFLGVMAKSKHQPEAWAFLKWFTQDIQPASGTTRYGDLLAQTIGAIPDRKVDITGNAQYLAGDPFKKTFIDQLPFSVSEPNVAHAADLKSALTNEILNAWAGSKTSTQALNDACTAINSLLATP